MKILQQKGLIITKIAEDGAVKVHDIIRKTVTNFRSPLQPLKDERGKEVTFITTQKAALSQYGFLS